MNTIAKPTSQHAIDRVLIAEALGWRFCPPDIKRSLEWSLQDKALATACWIPPGRDYSYQLTTNLPDFHRDWNACRMMLDSLTECEKVQHCSLIVASSPIATDAALSWALAALDAPMAVHCDIFVANKKLR